MAASGRFLPFVGGRFGAEQRTATVAVCPSLSEPLRADVGSGI